MTVVGVITARTMRPALRNEWRRGTFIDQLSIMKRGESLEHKPDLLSRWWFGRFELTAVGDMLHFRDVLVPPVKVLPRSEFAGLSGRDLLATYFWRGFIRPALSTLRLTVRSRPEGPDDGLFWQYPGRTEAAAWHLHAKLPAAGFDGTTVHVYVGMPWATWIDKLRKGQWSEAGAAEMERQVRCLSVRLSGYRHFLASIGLSLRIHTVCQHIAWRDLLATWNRLGVTDLWLSHCEPEIGAVRGDVPRTHPWRLFAVNVEDPSRRDGLQVDLDPADKPLLASFVGADASHYISDIRSRLQLLSDATDVVIRLRKEWHFERVVYREQVAGSSGDLTPGAETTEMREYNRLLSNSRFALCPAGAGRNTLRLWEALAVGAVPVLLGPPPELPRGGTLPFIDWDAIVLREPGDNLSGLLDRLRSMPIDEVRRRAALGRHAFRLTQAQRCFA